MKLISFSLYGNDPKYTHGLITNAKIKQEKNIYKNWDIIVYHDNTVPEGVLDLLKYYDVILKNVDGCGILPASWRFLAHDEPNVEIFVCRDADSRISERDEYAVADWAKSNKILHIMRDHPHHGYKILGGMWGMRTKHQDGTSVFQNSFNDLILSYQGSKKYTNIRSEWFMSDMNFLRDIVYSALGKPETSLIHAAKDYMHKVRWQNEDWAIDFPTPIGPEKYFVGEIFFFENGIQKRDYQYRER